MWQPKGAPVPLPPNGLVKAVESIVGGLSGLATTLVRDHMVLTQQQEHLSSKEEPLPVEVTQHKEVLGEATAQSKLHHSVLHTSR